MSRLPGRIQSFARERIPYGDVTHPVWYGLAHFVIGRYLGWRHDLQIYGRRNLGGKQQRVVAPNHEWVLDPAVMGVSVEGRGMASMAKAPLWTDEGYRRFGLSVGRIIQIVDAFPVRRGEKDRGALRQLHKFAKLGYSIGIFGTETRTTDLSRMTNLPASTAYKHDLPIQPMAIVRHKSNPESPGIVRVIASKPIKLNRDESKAAQTRTTTQRLITILERDVRRARAWAEFDAKYSSGRKRLTGRIKRF